MPRPKKEENKEENKVDQVLAALEEERKARKELEAKLQAKEEAERKEADPMSGPGELCQATKITRSEAWQVKNIARVNPKTRTVETVPDMSQVPPGYTVRYGPTNAVYIVEKGREERSQYPNDEEVVIPNCRSTYTEELSVYTKKPVQDRGNWKKEPPRMRVHLCEHHAKLFGAKSDEQLKKEGLKVPA